jgi:para-nitrobenzyl esterase
VHRCTRPLVTAVALSLFLLAQILVRPGLAAAIPDPGIVVPTRAGLVLGSLKDDHRQFLGVPYAAPPTGKRRWAAPAPPAPWSGIRSTQVFSPWCAQSPQAGLPAPSSEDCLYLDVYAPLAARSRKAPVMVWFYGGAYEAGTTSQYRPVRLVTEGSVVNVMVNYRLGAAGFLSLPGISGNFGLLDQQAALRWVRDNIAAFGGDPSNVTIFGQSAGGNSVCQQLASPTARGLFHRAIIQSGGCGGPLLDAQTPREAHAAGLRYARSVGCAEPRTALACLRSRSKDELVDSPLTQFISGKVTLRPVIDGKTVIGRTTDVFARGGQAKVPVIIGGTRDEGTLLVALFYHLTKLRTITPAEYRSELRNVFGAARARQVASAYPASRYGSADQALAAVYTDALFACPAAETIATLGRSSPAVFAYELVERTPPQSDLDPLMPLRSFHGSDVAYLDMSSTASVGERDRKLSTRMIADWTRFARTGTLGSAWPRASAGSLLAISRARTGPASLRGFAQQHRCSFWPSTSA